jgi:parallel beta-helix repeat protein
MQNIHNNFISDNINGIYLQDSDDFKINYNQIYQNTDGLLISLSESGEISSNQIYGNVNGMRLELFHFNQINFNTIENNNVGIELVASSSNSFFGNTYDNFDKQLFLTNSIDNFFELESFSNNHHFVAISNSLNNELLSCDVDKSKIDVDATSSATLKWRVKVKVQDELGNPIQGAKVNAYDDDVRHIFKDVTSVDGLTSTHIITDETLGFGAINYNPHVFKAGKFMFYQGPGGMGHKLVTGESVVSVREDRVDSPIIVTLERPNPLATGIKK